MTVLFWKELADHLNSTRFIIILCLILSLALLIGNSVSLNLASVLTEGGKTQFPFLRLFTTGGSFFSLLHFIALFGPLLAIVIGFDGINRERNTGTLSLLLCQPIYRDSVINSKFLAGMVTLGITFLSLTLLVSALGMIVVGVVPTFEEIARLITFFIFLLIYLGLWLAIAQLFSIVFESPGTSALATLVTWITLTFMVGILANLIASAALPTRSKRDVISKVRQLHLAEKLKMLSPVTLFTEAQAVLLDPGRRTSKKLIILDRSEKAAMRKFKSALPFSQSLLVVTPYLTSLCAMSFVCFAASYILFMRQDIRAL